VTKKLLVVSVAALVSGALLGCFDAIAPRSPHARGVSLRLAPVFVSAGGAGTQDGIPGDVDLIRIVLHHPPAADTTLNIPITPGQDSIIVPITITLNGTGTMDTVGVDFQAIRSSDGAVLYSGQQSYQLSPGVSSAGTPLVAAYVGPGQNIKSIAIAPKSVTIKPGDSLTFVSTALDSSGATIVGMPVLFDSRNTGVVTVTAGGVAKGMALGSTYVVLTSGARASVKDSALVTVSTVAPAAIALSATTANFVDTLLTSDPAAQTLNVTNAGGGVLSGLSVGTIAYGAGATGWLVASLAATTAPTTLTLQAAKGSLAAGTYTATVPVQSSSATNSPQNVTVTFTIAPAPTIGLSAGSVTFSDTLLTSDPAAQTVNVTSAGGTLTGLSVGTINYGTGGTGWLKTASLSATTTPTTLTLGVAKGSLAAGTYTATVPVASSLAGNSPQNVTVTFTIAPLPLVTLAAAPGYRVLRPGDTVTVVASGKNGSGNPAPALGLTYTSRSPGVATVNVTSGLVTAVASGTAVIVAQAPTATGTAADSMLVAVPASGSAVVAAIGDGRAFDVAGAGNTVNVLVLVDLRAVPGDTLGSYNAELDWNTAALTYVSWAAVTGGFATPTVNATNVSGGQLRFGSADPSGSGGAFALIQVTFAAAAAGSTPLTLTLTDLSTAKTFVQLLPAAVIVSGNATVH
jgi:hypothetical protein